MKIKTNFKDTGQILKITFKVLHNISWFIDDENCWNANLNEDMMVAVVIAI